MTPRLRRRSVLSLVAALPAARVLGVPAEDDDPLRRICARAASDSALAALGRAWCRLHPESSRGGLIEALAADLPRAQSEAALLGALRERAVEDFRDSRIVALGGWHLALTEARICAAGVAPD